MYLILDTCGLLSLAGIADKKLSTDCLTAIQSAGSLYISSSSAFEIALKHKRGHLDLGDFQTHDLFWEACKNKYILSEVPISAELFSASVGLFDHHADPVDRLIIATALTINCPVVTYDKQFGKYPVVTME